jgi:exonuclease SbcC
MGLPLLALEVSNFRTIRGSISVPLGASVVLVHGDNGAGKTTLLSAIELAMTGEIQALRDAETGYVDHLPNADGGDCAIRLEANKGAIDGGLLETEFLISRGRLTGAPLLDPSQQRFFTERCFLVQSSLGRLLDLYQNPEGRGESSLVRFVNELLGLDDLDSLIAGLHAAGDERRIRKVVPEYEGQQSTIRTLESAIASSEKRLANLRSRARGEYEHLLQALEVGSTRAQPSQSDLAAIEARLSPDGSEDDLARLSSQAERLSELQARVARLPQLSEASETLVAEAAAARHSEVQWRVGPGQRLAEALDAASGPAGSLTREQQLLAQDNARTALASRLVEELEAARGELAMLDAELATLTVNWDGLAEALVAVAPHISGEECPVCGRDYSEVSDEPLVDHTARLIAQYSEAATRVQQVAEERSSAQAKVASAMAAHADVVQQVWTPSARAEVEARLLALTDAQARLAAFEEVAAGGSALVREASALDARVRDLGSYEAADRKVRSQISDEWSLVYGPDASLRESPAAALTGLQGAVAESVRRLEAHVRARSELRTRLDGLRRLFAEQVEAEERLAVDKSVLNATRATLAKAKTRMHNARAIAAAAAQARAAIVATVFNGSLNKTWHDLFIRLAPDEPYVPSFGVPTTDRRLTEVQLETVHRFGGLGGGTPGAMLSAGNLNTAALTLFLALHLSVEPKVGCIVLDDPVQSMDEVHVAQFAALLRTLSRQLGRQVVLAVHERSLFEYLRLELSPSASGATLITVELERHGQADTECRSSVVRWEEELSIRALADVG